MYQQQMEDSVSHLHPQVSSKRARAAQSVSR